MHEDRAEQIQGAATRWCLGLWLLGVLGLFGQASGALVVGSLAAGTVLGAWVIVTALRQLLR